MGGSSGTFGRNRSPAEILAKLKEQVESSGVEFETELQKEFSKLLSRFNSRNTQEVAENLQKIKDLLHDNIESTFDTLFGGSVAKHTYVDGISDIDSMLVIAGELSKCDPQTILKTIAKALDNKLENVKQVTTGRVAITVSYLDGTEIQLVPTVEKEGKLNVPAWESNAWSTIDPNQFRKGLTKRNEECNGRLIPTIKLAKAVNTTLPESVRLTGYHIESLGVAAFREYSGEKTTVRMLPHFFKKASELVLSPMADRTGQSIHVDSHLGPANSESRQVLSHTLARIHKRMVNASAAKSRDRWMEIMGE